MNKDWILRTLAKEMEYRGGPDDENHPVPAPAEAPNDQEGIHSIAHRANDIAVNLAHARNHVLKAMESLHTGNKDDSLFNMDHAQRHFFEVEEIAIKMAEQIKEHPELRKEWDRLQRDNVMNQIIDPHNTGPTPPSRF
jgi:hypothetical protein